MNRRSAIFGVLSLPLATACTKRPGYAPLRENAAWSVRARYTDCCCCQPPCPCLLGFGPTHGYCEGVTLIEIERGQFEDVRLDGVKVLAVYRGGDWFKFYVDNATTAQTEAAVKLLPAFEGFFVSDNVLEVRNVPISVERTADRVKIATPNTYAEIEVVRGVNGQPIQIQGLPAPEFPAPPFQDHTQHRSLALAHEAEDQRFEYSGTTGFTAWIEAVAPAGG